MENNAAAAEFVDYKLVKTRSVAQIILEIDIARVDEVVHLLGGTPQPERSQWVALAPLKGSYGPSEVRTADDVTRRSWKTLTATEQACIRCKEPLFWDYIESLGKFKKHPDDKNERNARAFILGLCGVRSRSELASDEKAAASWRQLDMAYIRWLFEPAEPEVSASKKKEDAA